VRPVTGWIIGFAKCSKSGGWDEPCTEGAESSMELKEVFSCVANNALPSRRGMALRVVLGPRCGCTLVGADGTRRWRCGQGWLGCVGMIGGGTMARASEAIPGMLLRVTRRWRRGVVCKLRYAVGFRVRRIGGAVVSRGNVVTGDASAINRWSKAWSGGWRTVTLCSGETGGR